MTKFDDIRPYHDDEVKKVLQELLVDTDFLNFLGRYHSPRLSRYIPGVVRFFVRRFLKGQLGNVSSVREFQQMISSYAKRIVETTMTQFVFKGIDSLQANQGYLFVGNHRDIAGDSMLVDYALWLSDHDTVRIAVGDNLIQRKFATDIMRLNKSFFIRRSEEGAKKVYAALLQSSEYIHHSIEEKQSIWIAQSEGRAKDGLDNTDPAIVKMFALAKRKEPLANTVASLNIIPVSISYEFDPCDYLKAKERYAIDAEGSYDKPSGEDLLSLVKGLGEFKGRVHLNFGEKIHGDFETAEEVANALDRQILENYQLYQVNYWALKLLAQQDSSGPFYDTWQALGASVSFSDTSEYEKRMDTCEQIWRRKWLEMYANPVVNKHMSRCSHLTPI
jgi:hypothetical protein